VTTANKTAVLMAGDKQAADSASMEATPAAAKQDAAQGKPTQAGDVSLAPTGGTEAATADLGAQTVQHKQDAQDANDATTVHAEADTALHVKPEAVVHQSAPNAAADRTAAQKPDMGLAANQASASNVDQEEQDKEPVSVPKSAGHLAPMPSKPTQGAPEANPMSLASNALDPATAPGQPQIEVPAKEALPLTVGVVANDVVGLDKREADAAVPMDEGKS